MTAAPARPLGSPLTTGEDVDMYGPPPRGAQSSGYAWRFWTFNWGAPAPGEHRITSRSFDTDGNIQPAPSDPFLTSRRTYWEGNGHISRRVLIP
jgi:hypothetical protein